MPKPSQRAERKRAVIRKAAYACFRDSGYHLTSVDQICERAGISKGSFYWHYSSKLEVFVDLLEDWTRQIMAEVYEGFERALEADDYVAALTQALMNEARRGRVIIPLWLEFNLQAQWEPEIRGALAKLYRRARLAIAEMLRPMSTNMSDTALVGIANIIFGAYMGVLMQEMADPEGANVAKAVTPFMSVVGSMLESDSMDTGVPLPMEGDWPALLADVPLDVRELLSDLRARILDRSDQWVERVVLGRRYVVYGLDRQLIYLKPVENAVRVGVFERKFLATMGPLTAHGKRGAVVDVAVGTPAAGRTVAGRIADQMLAYANLD